MDDIVCLTLGEFEVNCFLFSYEDKLCVVDPGDACTALIHEIDEICRENNLTFSSIYLTHGHLDHVAGLNRLKKIYPDVTIYIGSRDKSFLGHGSYDVQYKTFSSGGMGSFVLQTLKEGEDIVPADVYVSDGDVVFGDWKVIETSGHTQGSTCLYNENRKIVFTGDTLMFYNYGRTDLSGGSDTDIHASLKKILALPKNTIVCPGHENYGFKLQKAFLWSFMGTI
ncbi:MAG: MBL fold metallo-hydrolase [Treponemataceae bacterium]|nr:MBL fold metallo-hydrolase [Spirochaetales bacterium]MDY6031788.1 MBL fold metallo-hydrolase [Treponemataceae bacterium]